jgi:hypothetical protein
MESPRAPADPRTADATRLAGAAELTRRRRARRRLSSICFLVAGVGFGTALYLLRARFYTLASPGKRAAFFALVAFMAIFFWLGSRAESEVTRLDDELRDLYEREARDRRR